MQPEWKGKEAEIYAWDLTMNSGLGGWKALPTTTDTGNQRITAIDTHPTTYLLVLK
jgi:hypothetical protein